MHRQFGLDIISLRYWGTPLGQRLPLTNFEVFFDKTWRTLPHNTHRHYKVGGEFRPLKLTRVQIILYCSLHFANTNCLPSRMFRGYTRRGATAKSAEFKVVHATKLQPSKFRAPIPSNGSHSYNSDGKFGSSLNNKRGETHGNAISGSVERPHCHSCPTQTAFIHVGCHLTPKACEAKCPAEAWKYENRGTGYSALPTSATPRAVPSWGSSPLCCQVRLRCLGGALLCAHSHHFKSDCPGEGKRT